MLIWFDIHVLIVFICPNATVSLCTATSALCPSGMTYKPLFHAIRSNTSDMQICCDTPFWHYALNTLTATECYLVYGADVQIT